MNSKYYIKYTYDEPDDGSIVVYDSSSGVYYPTNTLNYLNITSSSIGNLLATSSIINYSEVNFLYPVTDLISILGNTSERFKDIFSHKLRLYNSASIEPSIQFEPTSGSLYNWIITPFASNSTTCLGFYFNGGLKAYLTPDGNMKFFVT